MTRLTVQIRNCFLYSLSWIIIIFPSWLKIPIYRHIYGYKIGKHVKIGLSWIFVGRLEIGDYVRISSLTRIKGILYVQIGDHTTIGACNTFTATYEFTNNQSLYERENRPELTIGRHVGIAMFHYFDVQDAFSIGDFTTVSGNHSIFFTHYLDVVSNAQSTRPIYIGNYCMIGAAVRFAPGASVPDCCVVGMGAVVTKKFEEPYCMLGGNPARFIRKLAAESAYFHRQSGWISSYTLPPW